MEDNYKFAALMHRIAAVAKLPRNDGCLLHPCHCEPKAWQSGAFSLIELLISLIIISLIASSFIPIITRKIKYQRIQSFSYNFKTKDCPIDCNFCNSKNCIQCKDGYELKDNIRISSGEIYCNKLMQYMIRQIIFVSLNITLVIKA